MERRREGLEVFLGVSPAVREVREFARKASGVNVPVLILGETGTGKSLLGRLIHAESPWGMGPYQAVNCAGIPDTLFESEFFGHHRGAFTGAREGRKGILEQGQGGSVFLDEIGELSVTQQSKLLTALEDGEIRRIGGEGTVRIQVRIMAATARDLSAALVTGDFRRDLFHRLAVLTCHIPPLRAHKEDIPLLARRFLSRHQRRHGFPERPLGTKALAYLMEQPWPGNVREMSHRLEAALILSGGQELGPELLRAARGSPGTVWISPEVDVATREAARPTYRALRSESGRYSFHGGAEEEKKLIQSTLRRCLGNRSRTARELGMSRNTLRARLRTYGIE